MMIKGIGIIGQRLLNNRSIFLHHLFGTLPIKNPSHGHNYKIVCTGLHGRNCVIGDFVFSLVLVGLSFTDVIPVFLHLKSTVYTTTVTHEEANDKQKSEDDGEQ